MRLFRRLAFDFLDISKSTLDVRPIRYICNSDITKQDLKPTCLDVIPTITAATAVITVRLSAAIRSASTVMKATIAAAAAWAGSSITATCAWSC